MASWEPDTPVMQARRLFLIVSMLVGAEIVLAAWVWKQVTS